MVRILELIDEPLISCLVRLAGQEEKTEPAFQAAFIIRHIIQHGTYSKTKIKTYNTLRFHVTGPARVGWMEGLQLPIYNTLW